MTQPTAIVVGVGAEQGLGAALARKLAAEGYYVFVAGRTIEKISQVVETITSAGGNAEPITIDATREDDVVELFRKAFAPRAGYAPPDLVIFNAGNNKKMSFLDVTAAQFEDFWRVGCYAGFLAGREAAKHLAPLGRGTILFTGASGSLRGKPGFSHFAAAKAGLRMVAQSMAREFGPKGIHVAHIVIDGGINGDRLRQAQPARVAEQGASGLLGIDAIAEAYWFVHQQKPSAWTQELDLRPFKEPF